MNYALILCGGSGSRFWPKSRRLFPKQFLKTVGPRTMIQLTVDRISKFIPLENIYIVTNTIYTDIVKEQIPEIKEENIIIEPFGKETATCIGYATVKLIKQDPDAIIMVFPSDHHIQDEDEFVETLKQGLEIAASSDCLITMGIKPTRPETGYGYIETGKPLEGSYNIPTYKVKRFTEKPNLEKAREFIDKGTFLWNSGMFIWKGSALLKQYKKYLPDMYQSLKIIKDAVGTEEEAKVVEEQYNIIDGISIDYGIMEKAHNVCVMECKFRWDDIGSWTALERYMESDENHNIKKGFCGTLDTNNCILYGEKRLIAAVGVKDLIVVDTEDVLLICRKDRDQDIKELLKLLKTDENYAQYI